jgi:SAM-dependent methyltransferase
VNPTYWRGAVEDEAMQDEHGFIWLAMLDTIDTELSGSGDLSGSKVLDAGCNRGGFLRLLVDRSGIGDGYGYDPAAGAVADARRLSGGRPLTFEVAATVPEGWTEFDVAFSHEVLYLLHDLGSHARAMRSALKPGAAYFAVMGMHSGSALMSQWHASKAEELDLPRIYSLDEVVAVFEAEGFDAAVSRLKLGFVPVSAHRDDHDERGSLMDWMHYYTEDKVLLRFTKPV